MLDMRPMFGFALALLAAGATWAQEAPPIEAPSALHGGELRALPAQRLVGERPHPPASVARGETIVGFPFAFNRTAVLSEDVAIRNRYVKGVLAQAGSPGFFAGLLRQDGTGAIGEVWCFLNKPDSDPSKIACLMTAGEESTYIPGNPYVLVGKVQKRDAVLHGTKPRFEEKPVAIPGDLRLEYRFDSWTSDYAEIEELAGGSRVMLRPLRRQSDGRALLKTLAGDFWLAPVAGDPARADVSPVAP